MKLLRFELKKVFTHKWFQYVLIFTVLLNVFALYQTEKAKGDFAETKGFYNELREIPADEKEAFIKENKNEKALSEFQKVSGYNEYLSSIEETAENLSAFSVFCDSVTEFSKDNIEKTARDFEKMRDIKTEYDINNGVDIIVNSQITDFCIMLMLVVLGMALITDEKDKRIFSLLRAAPGGMGRTILSKISALFVCSLFANAVITLSSMLFAGGAYGFGDLSRSVQSVPDMMTSILHINIGELFVLLFCVKTLGVFIIGLLVMLLCLITKRAVVMLVSVIALSGGSFALTFIPETAEFNHLKFVNLYSLVNPYNIFKSYLNLNIFGKAVNVITVFAVFAFVAFAALTVGTVVYYLNKRPLENTLRASRKSLFYDKVHGSYRYFEWKKLMIINKAAAIILIFAALQSYAVYNQTNYRSNSDYYYKYCMEMLEGELTPEKEVFVLNEKAEIDEAEEKLNELSEKRYKGEISTAEFISLQAPYSEIIEKSESFEDVYEKYLYIKETPGAEFFFDRGYEKLFGIADENFSFTDSVLLMCVFAFCLCGVFSLEYKNSMYKVLNGTAFGANKTRKTKLGISLVTSFIIFAVAYLPEIIYIGRFYGFPMLSSPIMNISALKLLGNTPVWCGILILYILRFAVIALLVPIISAVSLKTKNNVITAVIFSVIFVLPMLLYALGLEFVKNLSVWNLISGSVLSGENVLVFAVQFTALLFLSILSMIYIKRNFGKAD